MSESDSSDDDFSLEPPSIIRQLKSILDQYGDGQILKELIQNADDAGAKTVKFMYDKSEYPTEHLYHPQLKQFQGCALYAYNDATFTTDDWNGIRLLQDSLKKNDPSRVGRFGLGFKSIFHLTDLPSIASGGKIGFIDPHAKYFKKRTGKLWNISRKNDMEQHKDQFVPFDNIYSEINLDGDTIDGTLFRFPLRQNPSKLSEVVYTEDKLDSLFDDLKSEAHTYLLFLKHVENIEISKRESPGSTPIIIYSASIEECCREDVRKARSKIVFGLKEAKGCHAVPPFPVMVMVEKFDEKFCERTIEKYKYIVSEYLGDISRFGTEHENIPLVGTAMIVSTPNSNTDLHEESSVGNVADKPAGKIFCFLPLPLEQEHSSGLPVHVNGYFEVSHNRNHLEWLKKQDEPVWNQILLSEYLPRCYLELLLGAISLHKENPNVCQPSDIYKALPHTDLVDEKWKVVTQVVYDFISNGSFYTYSHGGIWVKIDSCYIYDHNVPKIVIQLLLDIDVNVVNIPQHILKTLDSTFKNVKRVTPQFLRNKLRENQNLLHDKQRQERLTVLDYILSDNNPSDVYDVNDILPLANGTFTVIKRKGDSEPVYMHSTELPLSLLPGLEHNFADNLEDEIKKKLYDLAVSGKTQLECINRRSFCIQVLNLLPKDMHGQDTYLWDEECHTNLPDWWRHLWIVLSKDYDQHHSMYCDVFRNMPILPVNNHSPIMLVKISKSPGTILNRYPIDDTKIDDVSSFMLEHNGIYVPRFQNIFECIKQNEVIVARCFLSPTPENVLGVLQKHGLISVLLEALKSKLDLSFYKTIFDLFYRLTNVEKYKAVLAELPIFKSIKSTVERVSISKATGGLAYGCNLDFVTDLVDDVYIVLEKEECQLLSKRFDMKVQDMWGILRGSVVPKCRHRNNYTKLIPVFEKIFKEARQLQLDSSHMAGLGNIPFVSTAVGEFKSPNMLYKSNQTLKDFFGQLPNKFPSGVYGEHKAQAILEEIGLQTEKDVSATEILKQAKYLDTYKVDDNMATNMANAIVNLLKSNKKLVNQTPDGHGKRLADLLLDLAWMPVVQERPPKYPNTLFWAGTNKLEKPRMIKSQQWNNIIGSVLPIAKTHSVHDILSSPAPSVDEAINHLKNVVKSYDSSEKTQYLVCIIDWYQFFVRPSTHGLSNLDSFTSHTDLSFILTSFERHGLEAWAWHGDGFCRPSKLLTVKRSSEDKKHGFAEYEGNIHLRDLRPYLYIMPEETEQFSNFFISCGAQTTLSQTLMLDIVKNVQQTHSGDVNLGKNRVQRDVKLVVHLLQDTEPVESDDVLIPIDTNDDCTLQMLPASECTYLDTDWLCDTSADTQIDGEDRLYFIHPKLPKYVAEMHKVPSLMHRLVEDDELPSSFGQAESLVDRIRGLLEQYSDGMSIPKEMIQNADDAGASKVDILVDMRENNDAKQYLLDENMKLVQGPALWVHNNATFSEDDFKNIIKLGGRTKEQKEDTIGKFGLGFNAVYNVTDVPSFVSGHDLIIFDPQTKFLGKAIRDKSKPGIKIDLKKNKMFLSKMKDQFKPYQGIFDCTIDPSNPASYDGTLFRLPLRSHATLAFASELCGESGKPYTEQEIKALLSMLSTNAHELLLFTQHVSEINVYYLARDAHPSQQEIMLRVTRNVDLLINPKHIENRCVTNFLANAAYNIKPKKTQGRKPTNKLKTTYILATGFDTYPKGRDFLGIKQKTDSKYWLISHACVPQTNSNLLGKLPVGGCTLELLKHEPGKFSLVDVNEHGKPFVFLPLPMSTGLKFHINGCFAVDSSRKTIVTKDIDDKGTPMEHSWNISLLENSVLESFIGLLFDLNSIVHGQMSTFYSVWPQINKTQYEFRPFAFAFYKEVVARSDLPFTKENGEVVLIENVRFLDKSFARSSDVQFSTVPVLRRSHPQLHFTVASNKILDNFDIAGFTNFREKKTFTVRDFYESSFMPNLNLIPAQDRDRLLLFAIKDHFDEVKDLLAEKPCIPVSPNGAQCKLPKDLISPYGECAALFSNNDSRFPHGVFANQDILVKLEQIGLLVNDFTWADLFERAENLSIVVVEDQYKGHQRFRAILNALERHLRNEQVSDTCKKNFRELPFIPLQQKSSSSNLPWKNDEFPPGKITLLAPKSVCMPCYKELVCTELPVMLDVYLGKRTISFLGLEKADLDVSTVVVHLKNLSKLDVSTMSDVQLVELENAIYKVYDFVQDRVETDDKIWSSMSKIKCVFQNSQFLSPSEVAFNLLGECAPYFHRLSGNLLKRFKQFFIGLVIKEDFGSNDFIAALVEIKKRQGNKALHDDKVDIIINILENLVVSVRKENILFQNIQSDILVPNANGTLCKAGGLCYSDISWSETTSSKLTHPKISQQQAKTLGIKSAREAIMLKCGYGIPCGQTQKLCINLKRILVNYPTVLDIFLELAQNADDAGATEIHFILDKNTYDGDKLLGDSLKELQGPALCVYNNTPFKEKDLEGIQKLGEGSKGSDLSASGQYGIGFNTVYHITDVPCIMTTIDGKGTQLLMLDPNCTYVPGTNLANPGMRYKNLDELNDTFPDMFRCFPLSTCDTKRGTLFRFPLRSTNMARSSNIKDTETTVQDIEALFKEFKSQLKDILVFTKSLDSIKMSVIGRQSNNVRLQYAIQRSFAKSDRAAYQNFNRTLNEFAQICQRDPSFSLKSGPQQVSYEISLAYVEDEKRITRELHVVQQLGITNSSDIPKSVVDAVKNNKLQHLPLGGVACNRNLISEPPSRLYSLMPIPVSNPMPVHINGDFVLGYENRRQLWSADQASYTKDWNELLFSNVIASCYIRLLDDVKAALEKCSKNEYMSLAMSYYHFFPRVHEHTSEWYLVARSFYMHLLKTKACLFAWSRLKGSTIQMTWCGLNGDKATSGYFATKDHVTKLEFSGESDQGYSGAMGSTYIGSARVDSSIVQSGNNTKSKHGKLLYKILDACGYKVLMVPYFILQNFKRLEMMVFELTPETLIDFLSTHHEQDSLCTLVTGKHISDTPFENSAILNKVLRYCMTAKNAYERLNKKPLLLTADKVLRCFDKTSPVFDSTYSNLLQNRKHLFIDSSMSYIVELKQKNLYLKTFHMHDLDENLRFENYAANIRNKDSFIEWTEQPDLPSHETILAIWRCIKEDVKKERGGTFQTASSVAKKDSEYIRNKLSSWNLLPVSNGKIRYLVPFSLSYLIFDESTSDSRGHFDYVTNIAILRAISTLPLCKLQFHAQIDYSMLSRTGYEDFAWVNCFCSNISQPQNVLKMLCHIIENNESTGNKLAQKKNDCSNLFKYLNEAIKANKLGKDLKMKMRILPIYENMNGNVTNIPENFHSYTIPKGVPQDEIAAWKDPLRHQLIFLPHDDKFKQLYDYIDCHVIDCVEVYTKFIFYSFQGFSVKVQMSHINFLYQTYIAQHQHYGSSLRLSRTTNEGRKLLEKLKSLEFIRDTKGDFRSTNSFFDPEIELFKQMEDVCDFPPTCTSYPCNHEIQTCGNTHMNRGEWLPFLRSIGLKTIVTPDMITQYAKAISQISQSSSKCSPMVLQQKGRAIVKHLFKHMEECDMIEVINEENKGGRGAACDDSFKNVKFIQPYVISPLLKSICTQNDVDIDGNSKCIAFKNSLAHEYAELAWTRENILPAWANPGSHIRELNKVESIRQKLCIQASPKTYVVVDNFLTVCERLGELKQQIENTAKVDLLKKYYDFFENTELTEIDINRLKTTKCLLVNGGKDLVTPQDMVHHLDRHEIMQPYLYKVPLDLLGGITKLLQVLGVSENPTPAHYVMILNKLYKKTGKSRLSLNEKQIAAVAMAGLFSSLDTGETIVDDGNISIRLLSVNGTLCLSNKLVFNDTPSLQGRIKALDLKFMMYLNQTGLRTSQREESLLEILPSGLRPQMLSNIVREVLTPNSQRDSSPLQEWNERLVSDEFCDGISRLLRHTAHDMNEDITTEIVDELLERLSLVRVFETHSLETKLVYKGEDVRGSTTQKTCFVHRQPTELGVGDRFSIYILASVADELHSDIIVELAGALNIVLAKRLSHSVLFLYSILQCPINQISTKLNHFNVRVDTTQESRRSIIFPVLGCKLETEDETCLDFECKDFRRGEYVAYRPSGSNIQVYAKIHEVVGNVVHVVSEPNARPSIVNLILLSKIP